VVLLVGLITMLIILEVVAEVLVDLEARIQETRGRVEVGPLPAQPRVNEGG